jgi:hypothetical protein
MDENECDNGVLGRLCEKGPLRPEELRREFGIAGIDALDRLVRKGLAHRIGDDFVIASASGRHANAIDPTYP